MQFFPMKDRTMEGQDMVELTTLYDEVFASILEGLFRENGIIYIKKDRGFGGSYTRIFIGSSGGQGMDFFVKRDQLEDATALMNGFLNAQFEEIAPESESE